MHIGITGSFKYSTICNCITLKRNVFQHLLACLLVFDVRETWRSHDTEIYLILTWTAPLSVVKRRMFTREG